MRPFERTPFEALPERPSPPHGYEASEAHELELSSRPFGRVHLHYRALGAGPPLLLVHGLMTSSYSFRYVLEPLARHFRVYAPDLPGAGRTTKVVDRPYHPEALAAVLGELIEALDLRGCAAIGNSLGGYLCMRLALSDPGAMSRLVNLHSPSFPQARHRLLHAALSQPLARRALVAAVRRDPERWAHANVHYWDESRKSREEARVYGAALAEPGGAEAFVRWLHEAVAPRGLAELDDSLARRRAQGRPFPVPLMLLYATRDPMVDPEHGRRLQHNLPDARFVWLGEASHFPHVDCPERLLEQVLPFLAAT